MYSDASPIDIHINSKFTTSLYEVVKRFEEYINKKKVPITTPIKLIINSCRSGDNSKYKELCKWVSLYPAKCSDEVIANNFNNLCDFRNKLQYLSLQEPDEPNGKSMSRQGSFTDLSKNINMKEYLKTVMGEHFGTTDNSINFDELFNYDNLINIFKQATINIYEKNKINIYKRIKKKE